MHAPSNANESQQTMNAIGQHLRSHAPRYAALAVVLGFLIVVLGGNKAALLSFTGTSSGDINIICSVQDPTASAEQRGREATEQVLEGRSQARGTEATGIDCKASGGFINCA